MGEEHSSPTFSWRHTVNHTRVLLSAGSEWAERWLRWGCGQKIRTDYLVVSAVIRASPAWIKELNYIPKGWQSGKRTAWHGNKYHRWWEVCLSKLDWKRDQLTGTSHSMQHFVKMFQTYSKLTVLSETWLEGLKLRWATSLLVLDFSFTGRLVSSAVTSALAPVVRASPRLQRKMCCRSCDSVWFCSEDVGPRT